MVDALTAQVDQALLQVGDPSLLRRSQEILMMWISSKGGSHECTRGVMAHLQQVGHVISAYVARCICSYFNVKVAVLRTGSPRTTGHSENEQKEIIGRS